MSTSTIDLEKVEHETVTCPCGATFQRIRKQGRPQLYCGKKCASAASSARMPDRVERRKVAAADTCSKCGRKDELLARIVEGVIVPLCGPCNSAVSSALFHKAHPEVGTEDYEKRRKLRRTVEREAKARRESTGRCEAFYSFNKNGVETRPAYPRRDDGYQVEREVPFVKNGVEVPVNVTIQEHEAQAQAHQETLKANAVAAREFSEYRQEQFAKMPVREPRGGRRGNPYLRGLD